MGESDWGKRLQNKNNSNNSNNSNNTNSSNKATPKFGTHVINEGFDQTNNGITRYEISENGNEGN